MSPIKTEAFQEIQSKLAKSGCSGAVEMLGRIQTFFDSCNTLK